VAQNRGMLEDVRRSVDFLQRVTDAQPTQISTFDAVGRYTFANRSAALEAGADASAIIGKSLIDVMGPHKSKLFTDLNDRALVSGRVVSERHQLDDGTDRTVQSSHIPLPKEQGADRVLMVVQDITDLLREKQRSDRALGTLVDTLIAILDSLVPYWASHSRRVAELAHGIGLEMAVDRMQAAAAELAGRLLNVGVLLVRPEILLKPGKLTDAELAEVRQKVYATAALLKDVDFEAPVIETLQQSQEFWDGSGFPLGLKGEAILLPARIVALSRSFVSMTSSRAYRQALSPQDAYELLSRQADHQFDRRVVAALGNYLFNRGGLERAASYGKP
jgi:PAS domain S-box-containing protein